MTTVPTIDYEKIKGVKNVPLEELYTSGHRTCQGCESATTMRGFIKSAVARTVLTDSTRDMHDDQKSLIDPPRAPPGLDRHARARRPLAIGHGPALRAEQRLPE